VRKTGIAKSFLRLHTACTSTGNLFLVSATFLLPRLQSSAKCTHLQLTTAARHDYRIRALAYLHPSNSGLETKHRHYQYSVTSPPRERAD
jgi:hypothetical protein